MAEPKPGSRTILTLREIAARGEFGMTWRELAMQRGWHHGQASSTLSVLHKDGKLARLQQRRAGCSVYVLPEHVADRETTARRVFTKPCPNCADRATNPEPTEPPAPSPETIRAMINDAVETALEDQRFTILEKIDEERKLWDVRRNRRSVIGVRLGLDIAYNTVEGTQHPGLVPIQKGNGKN